jgi:hypothetical protein
LRSARGLSGARAMGGRASKRLKGNIAGSDGSKEARKRRRATIASRTSMPGKEAKKRRRATIATGTSVAR